MSPAPTSVAVDSLWRIAATRLAIPPFCRLRRCARDRRCSGPLKPRPSVAGTAGCAAARMPACIALSNEVWFEVLERERDAVRHALLRPVAGER